MTTKFKYIIRWKPRSLIFCTGQFGALTANRTSCPYLVPVSTSMTCSTREIEEKNEHFNSLQLTHAHTRSIDIVGFIIFEICTYHSSRLAISVSNKMTDFCNGIKTYWKI